MNLFKNFFFSTIILFLFNTIAYSQWTYEDTRKLNKDIVINYKVTYDNKLTEKQKKSSRFINDIVLILNNNKLIEKKIGHSIRTTNFTLSDYQKQKIYKCNNSTKKAIYSDFKEPLIEGVIQKGEHKKIAGFNCEKYISLLKGKPVEVYTTKQLGLRHIKNFNVHGVLMEYPGFDKYLGFYKVKAIKTATYKLPLKTYSLEGYTLMTPLEYKKSNEEYYKNTKKT